MRRQAVTRPPPGSGACRFASRLRTSAHRPALRSRGAVGRRSVGRTGWAGCRTPLASPRRRRRVAPHVRHRPRARRPPQGPRGNPPHLPVTQLEAKSERLLEQQVWLLSVARVEPRDAELGGRHGLELDVAQLVNERPGSPRAMESRSGRPRPRAPARPRSTARSQSPASPPAPGGGPDPPRRAAAQPG